MRALAPGGEMDSGYEKVGLAMAPLGLEVTERPKVNIEVRESSHDFAAKSRKLKVESGPEGIVVSRKGDAQVRSTLRSLRPWPCLASSP